VFGLLREVRELVDIACGHADHRRVLRLEFIDRHREQVRLEVAACSVCGGEEVDDDRTMLQGIGELEGERLASQIGRCAEVGRVAADLQCGERRRRQRDAADGGDGGKFQQTDFHRARSWRNEALYTCRNETRMAHGVKA